MNFVYRMSTSWCVRKWKRNQDKLFIEAVTETLQLFKENFEDIQN